MRFIHIPKDNYDIGQIIEVYGRKAKIVAISQTGENMDVNTIDGELERIICICTDSKPVKTRKNGGSK